MKMIVLYASRSFPAQHVHRRGFFGEERGRILQLSPKVGTKGTANKWSTIDPFIRGHLKERGNVVVFITYLKARDTIFIRLYRGQSTEWGVVQ